MCLYLPPLLFLLFSHSVPFWSLCSGIEGQILLPPFYSCITLLCVEGPWFNDLVHNWWLCPFRRWRKTSPKPLAGLLSRLMDQRDLSPWLHTLPGRMQGPSSPLGLQRGQPKWGWCYPGKRWAWKLGGTSHFHPGPPFPHVRKEGSERPVFTNFGILSSPLTYMWLIS